MWRFEFCDKIFYVKFEILCHCTLRKIFVWIFFIFCYIAEFAISQILMPVRFLWYFTFCNISHLVTILILKLYRFVKFPIFGNLKFVDTLYFVTLKILWYSWFCHIGDFVKFQMLWHILWQYCDNIVTDCKSSDIVEF